MNEPRFTVDWHSYNIALWRRLLERYAGKPNVRALEIGSFEGRSTVWLLENILTHRAAGIDCIDTFEGSPEHAALDLTTLRDRFTSNIEPYRQKVGWFQGRSQDVLRNGFWDAHQPLYDFIYIDGSHRAADVLEDAVLSFRLLKLGGLMIFDDYLWSSGGSSDFDNPRRGVDAFYHAYQNQLKPVHMAYQAVCERVAESRVDTHMRPSLGAMREMVGRLV
jgi:predicted O-methyltransferase YrrM